MSTFDPETLLSHRGWLRQLARAVAGEAGADDLEQETWARALAARRTAGRDPRAWLARILRNTAREGWRREQHARSLRGRIAQEAEAPEGGAHRAAQPEPGLDVERHEAQQALLTALGALEEPYGSVLAQRFLDDLSVRAIADRAGLPQATVRTRLRRGLEHLRERMQRDLGEDWRARVLALSLPSAPAAVPDGTGPGGGEFAPAAAAPSASASSIAAPLALGLTVALLALPVAWLWTRSESAASEAALQVARAEGARAAALASNLPPQGERVPVQSEPVRDTSAVQDTSPRESAAPDTPDAPALDVLVVDGATGAPVPPAELLWFDTNSPALEEFRRQRFREGVDDETLLERFGERTTTDEEGRAQLPPRQGYLHLLARTDDLVGGQRSGYTYLFSDPRPGIAESARVGLVSRVDLEVQVVTASGAAAPDQRVEVQRRFRVDRVVRGRATTTDGSGQARFSNAGWWLATETSPVRLTLVAPVAGQRVDGRASGSPGRPWIPIDRESPPQGPQVLHLPPTAWVEVAVTDAQGRPAADGLEVHVQLAPEPEAAPPPGSLELSPGLVTAELRDGRARLRALPETELVAWCEAPDSRRLRAAGGRTPGVDETLFLTLELGPQAREHTLLLLDAQGAPLRSALVELETRSVRGRVQSPGARLRMRTDADGALQLRAPALNDGEEPERVATFVHHLTDGQLAYGWADWSRGSETRLVLGSERIVAGRVLDAKGRPVGGARVSVEIPDPWWQSVGVAYDKSLHTTADGSFSIAGQAVPPSLAEHHWPPALLLWLPLPSGGKAVHGPISYRLGQSDLVHHLRHTTGEFTGQILVRPGVAEFLSLSANRRDGRFSSSLGLLDDGSFQGGAFSGELQLALRVNHCPDLEERASFEVVADAVIRVPGWSPLDLREDLFLQELHVELAPGTREDVGLPDSIRAVDVDSGRSTPLRFPFRLPTTTPSPRLRIEAEGFHPTETRVVDGTAHFVLVPR